MTSLCNWHPFFTWMPTTLVDGRVAWMSWVERRYTRYDYGTTSPLRTPHWQFRECQR